MASRSSEEEGVSSMRKHLLTSTYICDSNGDADHKVTSVNNLTTKVYIPEGIYDLCNIENQVPLSLSRRDPAKMT